MDNIANPLSLRRVGHAFICSIKLIGYTLYNFKAYIFNSIDKVPFNPIKTYEAVYDVKDLVSKKQEAIIADL